MAQLLDPPVTAADLTEGGDKQDTHATMSATVVEINSVTVQSRAAQQGGHNIVDPLNARG